MNFKQNLSLNYLTTLLIICEKLISRSFIIRIYYNSVHSQNSKLEFLIFDTKNNKLKKVSFNSEWNLNELFKLKMKIKEKLVKIIFNDLESEESLKSIKENSKLKQAIIFDEFSLIVDTDLLHYNKYINEKDEVNTVNFDQSMTREIEHENDKKNNLNKHNNQKSMNSLFNEKEKKDKLNCSSELFENFLKENNDSNFNHTIKEKEENRLENKNEKIEEYDMLFSQKSPKRERENELKENEIRKKSKQKSKEKEKHTIEEFSGSLLDEDEIDYSNL